MLKEIFQSLDEIEGNRERRRRVRKTNREITGKEKQIEGEKESERKDRESYREI